MPAPATNQFTEVAEIYDDVMSVVPYSYWAMYVRSLWRRHGFEPRRVLDLACGTGNVTEQLRLEGLEVAGVDGSEAMLRVARRKLPPGTPLWHQDLRCLDLPGPPFDACVCLFDSLNYILELTDLERVFANCRRHVAPGGPLLFDVNAVRALETGMFNQKGNGRDASVEFEWHSAWDPASRLCTIQMEFRVHRPGGTRVFHERHVQRGYTREELAGALQRTGFRLLAVHDAFTLSAPTPASDRLHFLAAA